MSHPLIFESDKAPLTATDQARLNSIAGGFPSLKSGVVNLSTSNVTVPGSNAVLATGQVNPLGIASQGNVFAFVVQGNFGFSATANSLTIYWDGTHGSKRFVIKRANGGNFSVPAGSLAITGLTAATMYGFAPFISVAQPQIVSFAAGDSGTPRYGFSPSAPSDLLSIASQTQRLTTNESITNGLIYSSTAASGGTSMGTGSGSTTPALYTGNAERTY